MRIPGSLFILSAICALAAPASAQTAQCPMPHVLVNGEVADATEVMENFNAVAQCAEDAADNSVTQTGAPQTGEIVTFSGNQTVTGGDLTGDVTTSGSTATTLSDSGVIAGSYTNPSITVDSKGRVIAATSGSGSGGGGTATGWTEITINNPNAETGDTSGWTMAGGGFTAEMANPSGHGMVPIEGSYAFVPSSNAGPTMYQEFDLTVYAAAIDTGAMQALFEAVAADTYVPGEYPYVYLMFFDGAGNELTHIISATQTQSIGTNKWRHISAEGRIPKQARTMRMVIWAKRAAGTVNNLAYDEIRAFVRGN